MKEYIVSEIGLLLKERIRSLFLINVALLWKRYMGEIFLDVR